MKKIKKIYGYDKENIPNIKKDVEAKEDIYLFGFYENEDYETWKEIMITIYANHHYFPDISPVKITPIWENKGITEVMPEQKLSFIQRYYYDETVHVV